MQDAVFGLSLRVLGKDDIVINLVNVSFNFSCETPKLYFLEHNTDDNFIGQFTIFILDGMS